MAKGPTTGVRLEEEQRIKLEKIAAENGKLDVSVLIRWAVDALIAHAEKNGGRLLLPVDFSETFEVKISAPAEKARKSA